MPVTELDPHTMPKYRTFRRKYMTFRLLSAVTIIAILSMTACRSAVIYSARSPTYNHTPTSIFLVANLGSINGGGRPEPEELFAEYFKSSLSKCGIISDVDRINKFTPRADIETKIRAFNPDAILNIQWKTATTQYGLEISGNFHIDMLDVYRKVIVWDANLDMSGRYGSTSKPFINSMINRMVSDKVLPADCAVREEAPS